MTAQHEVCNAVVESFAASEIELLERVRDLEDERDSYRTLVQQLLARLHELEGDDLPGHRERVDDDVDRGLHEPPISVVARLKRTNRKLTTENRHLRDDLRACQRRAA